MHRFAHVGIPTIFKHENETYVELFDVYATEPEGNPYSVEYLRFMPGTMIPDIITKQNHVAYYTDDLDAAIDGEQIVLAPLRVSETRRMSYILKDGLLVELIEDK